MNTSLVRERIASHDSFVGLHAKADDLRKQLAGRVNLARVDTGLEWQGIGAYVHRHYAFFQRRIARSLADPVYGALNLSRAGGNGRQAVRDRQAKVIVTMNTDQDVCAIAERVFANPSHQFRK